MRYEFWNDLRCNQIQMRSYWVWIPVRIWLPNSVHKYSDKDNPHCNGYHRHYWNSSLFHHFLLFVLDNCWLCLWHLEHLTNSRETMVSKNCINCICIRLMKINLLWNNLAIKGMNYIKMCSNSKTVQLIVDKFKILTSNLTGGRPNGMPRKMFKALWCVSSSPPSPKSATSFPFRNFVLKPRRVP